jgi:hypothetical protein
MKIVEGISHLDHGLSDEQLAHIMRLFEHRVEFFKETITLPTRLGQALCALHGPAMGDDPIPSFEVAHVPRGDRGNVSRLCWRAPRLSSQVTVIAGPVGDEPCVLYTAYPGPEAPREVGDPSIADDPDAIEESTEFWAEHALSVTEITEPLLEAWGAKWRKDPDTCPRCCEQRLEVDCDHAQCKNRTCQNCGLMVETNPQDADHLVLHADPIGDE